MQESLPTATPTYTRRQLVAYLTTRSIGRDPLLWPIYLGSAAVTVVTRSEVVWLFVGAGLLVWMVRRKPRMKNGRLHGFAFAAAPAAWRGAAPAWTGNAWARSGLSSRMPPGVAAFVDGVTAAAVGAIAGAVVVLAQRSIADRLTACVALATVAILWRFRSIPEPVVVVAAALVGLAVHSRW